MSQIHGRALAIHKILTDEGWTTVRGEHNTDGFLLEFGNLKACVLDLALQLPPLKEGETDSLDSLMTHIMGRTPAEEEDHVAATKQFRKDLDEILQRVKGSTRISRERSLCVTKLQESIMWLGMDLKAQNTPSPYPESYNPDSPTIEPTADGLKL